MSKTTVIAEIGLNHAGSFPMAKLMCDKARAAEATIAKFQWYRPEELLGKDSPYLAEATKAQFSPKVHLII